MKINGNIVFNADATSEIQNAYVERLGSAPTFDAAHKGRLYFNTNTALFYYNDGSAYVPFATGGNAAALQQEVDAIEASMGSIVNSNGTYNGASAFSGVPIINNAASLTAALVALANAADGTDSLAELTDVQFGTLLNGQYLKYNSSTGLWNNSTLVLADVTDVTATAAEVNILDGATLSTAELNHVTGVTSSIQTQLNNKQPLDAGLTALAAFNTDGILVQTAEDTFVGRTLLAPTAGITIANPAGAAGNPSFDLSNDLAAVEGLVTNGYAVRTGTDTWTTRTISGATDKIVVTNGNGVASNTDIDLAPVTDSNTGTFQKITKDGYGRVTGTENVVASDITSLVSGIYVDVAGDTMTGTLSMAGGATVTGLPSPVDGTDAVNKNYADALVAGLTWKNAAVALADSEITIASAPATIDGVTLVAGDYVLLTGQSNAYSNGIYVFNGAGDALTRATNADTFEELNGAALFIQSGTVYGDSGWTQTAPLTSLTANNTQVWAQFTGSSLYTWGTGLGNTGNTVYVNLGAGIFEGPSDGVGIDLYAPANSALALTLNGTTRSDPLDSNARLHLMLKASGGLTQDINGLYVPTAGIANAMLANNSVVLNSDDGSGSVALGGTLLVQGDSVQGINTSATGGDITVTAADASTSQKGVASFDSGDFAVASGVVTVKAGGIDNAQLVNSTFSLAGDTGSGSAALGTTVSVVGVVGSAISTVFNDTTKSFEVNASVATTANKGVASFSGTDFDVTGGHVALLDQSIDRATDVDLADGMTDGSILVWNDSLGAFVPRQIYYFYEGSLAATVHSITHNLDQMYCNVTVMDTDDEVVIPQSIKFNNNNTLTVSFTSAIACRVVVMGVPTYFPSNQ